MISQKAKDIVGQYTNSVGGDPTVWKEQETILLNFISELEDKVHSLEKRVSDYGWEESARHAQATGGWQ